jgi:hypothetical protein
VAESAARAAVPGRRGASSAPPYLRARAPDPGTAPSAASSSWNLTTSSSRSLPSGGTRLSPPWGRYCGPSVGGRDARRPWSWVDRVAGKSDLPNLRAQAIRSDASARSGVGVVHRLRAHSDFAVDLCLLATPFDIRAIAFIGCPLARVGRAFAVVGRAVAVIRRAVAVIRRALARVARAVAVIGRAVARVGGPLTPLSRSIAFIGGPVPLVGCVCARVGGPFARLRDRVVCVSPPFRLLRPALARARGRSTSVSGFASAIGRCPAFVGVIAARACRPITPLGGLPSCIGRPLVFMGVALARLRGLFAPLRGSVAHQPRCWAAPRTGYAAGRRPIARRILQDGDYPETYGRAVLRSRAAVVAGDPAPGRVRSSNAVNGRQRRADRRDHPSAPIPRRGRVRRARSRVVWGRPRSPRRSDCRSRPMSLYVARLAARLVGRAPRAL